MQQSLLAAGRADPEHGDVGFCVPRIRNQVANSIHDQVLQVLPPWWDRALPRYGWVTIVQSVRNPPFSPSFGGHRIPVYFQLRDTSDLIRLTVAADLCSARSQAHLSGERRCLDFDFKPLITDFVIWYSASLVLDSRFLTLDVEH